MCTLHVVQCMFPVSQSNEQFVKYVVAQRNGSKLCQCYDALESSAHYRCGSSQPSKKRGGFGHLTKNSALPSRPTSFPILPSHPPPSPLPSHLLHLPPPPPLPTPHSHYPHYPRSRPRSQLIVYSLTSPRKPFYVGVVMGTMLWSIRSAAPFLGILRVTLTDCAMRHQ